MLKEVGMVCTYRTRVGCDGCDDEHEVERDDELQHEGLPVGAGRHGDPAMEEGMENNLQQEPRTDGPRHLRRDVRRHLNPGEMPERCEADGHRRVQVGAGDVACRQDDDHHRQPRAPRIADQRLHAVVLLVHYRRGRRKEDEDQGAHELRSQLQSERRRRRRPSIKIKISRILRARDRDINDHFIFTTSNLRGIISEK